MRLSIPLNSLLWSSCPLVSGWRVGGLLAATLLWAGFATAQTPQGSSATSAQQQTTHPRSHSSKSHSGAKQAAPAPEVAPAPPAPNWPVNDHANPASVTWDSRGLRIEASNSSLQAILRQVSVATGTKVEGMGADQRVYGAYGPGQAREVLSQLLQGSGYNVLLAGDLGMGAPRQILLSTRHGGEGAPGGANRPNRGQDANNDEDVPPDNEVEEQPPPVQQPQPMAPNQAPLQPGGFGAPGTVRTPQQVMEEMQQRQLLQQQQQQQQNNPPTSPQD
jgi:hypothetical protein